jgi:hypothetical protein
MVARNATARSTRMLVLAAAALLGACSRNQVAAEPGNEPAVVVFSNESLTQADLFAVVSGGGDARKLGTVMAGRTETLRLSADLAIRGSVSLVARLLNGGTLSTGLVPVHPGDTVHVQLPLNRSMLVFLP